jgi:hypothetical protein
MSTHLVNNCAEPFSRKISAWSGEGKGSRGGRALQRNGGWCCHQPPLSQLHGPPAGAASRWAGGSRTGAGPFVSRCCRSGRRRSAAPSCIGSAASRSPGQSPPEPVPAEAAADPVRPHRWKRTPAGHDPPFPKAGAIPRFIRGVRQFRNASKEAPFPAPDGSAGCRTRFGFRRRAPGFPCPVRFRFPTRFPAPRRDRNRFGSACRLLGVSLRFLGVAPSRLQE